MLGQFENLYRTTHAQVTVWGTVAEVDRVRNRLLPKVVRSSSLEHESQSAFQGCTVHTFGRGVHVGFIGRRASKPSPVGLQDFLGFLVGELGALVSMEPFWRGTSLRFNKCSPGSQSFREITFVAQEVHPGIAGGNINDDRKISFSAKMALYIKGTTEIAAALVKWLHVFCNIGRVAVRGHEDGVHVNF